MNSLRDMPVAVRCLIVVGCLIVWAAMSAWIGSLIFLWKAGLPKQLASPFFLYKCWVRYAGQPGVRQMVITSLAIAAGVMIVPFAVALFMPRRRKLYGDARLATIKDFKKADMLRGEKAFLFMEKDGKYIFSPSSRMVSAILAAPPRSGKGVSQVQTNMLSMDCSVIILDIRKESYMLTSGFRAKYSEVHLLDPFPALARDEDGKIIHDPETGEDMWECRSSQFNPLAYVPEDPALRINMLQKLANFLFPDPVDGKDKFWSASSRSLFLGLALYVFETPGLPRTIGEVLRQAQTGGDSGDSIAEYWESIIRERQEAGCPLSEPCALAIGDFIATGSTTLTNIRKSFTSALDLWQNPVVDAVTSGNSFDLRDLRKNKYSIYIGISPDNLERARPFIALFLQLAMDLNMQERPEENDDIKHPLAIIGDEITAAGRLEVIAKRIGYLNGYWIMLYIIIQSFAQLRSVYGKDDAASIIDCCQVKLAFAPKAQEDAEALSKEIGYITEKNTSVSSSRSLIPKGSGSTSESVARRALFLPQEIKALGPDAIIMLAEGVPPAVGKKVYWYKTATFKERQLPPYSAPKIDYSQTLKLQEERAMAAAANRVSAVLPDDELMPTADHMILAGYDADGQDNQNDQGGQGDMNIHETLVELAGLEDPYVAVPVGLLPILDDFGLDDFMHDLSSITVPDGDLTDEEMQKILTDFIQALSTVQTGA